jgi:hypothetical protein
VPRNSDDDKLQKALSELKQLEEVPADVSARFNQTLDALASKATTPIKTQPSRFQFTSFSIAASFFVVAAFGGIVTLNSSSKEKMVIGGQTTKTTESSDVADDQTLYSNNSVEMPISSTDPVQQLNSGTDYGALSVEIAMKLGIGNTYNSVETIKMELQACLRNLGIENYVSALDKGRYKGQLVQAIWSPATKDSWNVYILGPGCSVIVKEIVSHSA